MDGSIDDSDGDTQAASDVVPAGQRCVWPGCARRRAAGRAAGSGRQKEYCLRADPPEAGGGPVHNARNRWVALHGAASRPAQDLVGGGDEAKDADGHAGARTGGGEPAGSGADQFLFSAAKKRASDLLEQARRQHAGAVASLRAERELYQRLGEQLTALTDPALIDLEIAAIASRAGASVAQAEEDAVRARRAQLAAERERDDANRLRGHADAAAEQFAADAEAAESALAERTAAFDRDRAALLERAREADGRADRARAEAAAAKAEAHQAAADAERIAAESQRNVSEAREQAAAGIGAARAAADEAIARAQRTAEETSAQARQEAAEQVMAAIDRAREQVEAAQARADAQADQVRKEAASAVADTRQQLAEAREQAASQVASAVAEAERAHEEIGRLRDELRRLDAARDAEVARLAAAHQTALDAERGRVTRAENELDALRAASARPS